MVRTVETKIRVLRNGAQLTELEYAPNAAPTIRCSDSAASGSSRRYSPFARKLFCASARKLSPWDLS